MSESRIVLTPDTMLGKPRVAGTRITVEHILEEMAGGLDAAALIDQYPGLTAEDISAALAFAADAVHREWKAPVAVS